jgi:hypothetical protein
MLSFAKPYNLCRVVYHISKINITYTHIYIYIYMLLLHWEYAETCFFHPKSVPTLGIDTKRFIGFIKCSACLSLSVNKFVVIKRHGLCKIKYWKKWTSVRWKKEKKKKKKAHDPSAFQVFQVSWNREKFLWA